jgi:predicted transcriptional regulator
MEGPKKMGQLAALTGRSIRSVARTIGRLRDKGHKIYTVGKTPDWTYEYHDDDEG